MGREAESRKRKKEKAFQAAKGRASAKAQDKKEQLQDLKDRQVQRGQIKVEQ